MAVVMMLAEMIVMVTDDGGYREAVRMVMIKANILNPTPSYMLSH